MSIESTSEAASEGRGGRRRGRREGPARLEQPPFRRIFNPYPPLRAVSDDELEAIHQASLTVLEEIGIDFLLPEACDRLRAAGLRVDGQRVRFDRGFVEERIRTIPPSFTLHARNPARNVGVGGTEIVVCQIASAPNVSDLAGGRRIGNRKDFRNLIRLGHVLNAIHVFGGYPVEPVDIHASVRHLEALHDILTMSDKAVHAYSLGRERIQDGIEMVRIARGISREQLEREPSLFSIINSSSPLRLDHPMLQGIITMAEAGQPTVITPFTLAGAMAPVTIAGALVEQNAEALAGLAFSQVVRPGAPVAYGGFTSNVDMKSGAPAFGTPEYMKAALVGGQLARRYDIPYRSSNANAANVPDAQAAWESVFSLWGAVMGGVHILKHACGWMEGGLCASFEKMVMDADTINMLAEFLTPLVVNEDTLALEAMRDVGPGGHFFGTPHTQARFKTAFFSPMVSDWRNYESWQEAGSPDALTRSADLSNRLIAEWEAPPMDPAIREELDAFVAKRKEEGGAPTDF